MPDITIEFGRYKGWNFDEVAAYDPAWLRWVAGQPWIKTRQLEVFKAVMAGAAGPPPKHTPIHNWLQRKFLDAFFRRAFVQAAGPNHIVWKARQAGAAFCDELDANLRIATCCDDDPPWPPWEDFGGWWSELRDAVGGGVPVPWRAVLGRGAFNGHDDDGAWTARLDEIANAYTVQGPEFETVADVRFLEKPTFGALPWLEWRIEIKPTIADDYPATLRQMQRQSAPTICGSTDPSEARPLVRRALLYKRYGATAPLAEVTRFFASQRILMVSLEAVEAEIIPF